MKIGDVIRMTHFADTSPGLITHWKAEKGQVFLAVLIGTEPKDGTALLDIGKAIRALGCVPGEQLAKQRPDL